MYLFQAGVVIQSALGRLDNVNLVSTNQRQGTDAAYYCCKVLSNDSQNP